MTTPEMLAYIRAELAKGKTRQAIHLDLLHGGGWTEEDIQEAFTEIPLPAAVIPTAVPQASQFQPQIVQQPVSPVSEIQARYQPTSPQPVQPAAPATTPPPDPQFVTPLQFIEAQQHQQQPVTQPSEVHLTVPPPLPIEVQQPIVVSQPAVQPVAVPVIPAIDHAKEKRYFLLGTFFFIISFLAVFILEAKTVAIKFPIAEGLILPIFSYCILPGYAYRNLSAECDSEKIQCNAAFMANGILCCWCMGNSYFVIFSHRTIHAAVSIISACHRSIIFCCTSAYSC